MIKRRDPAREVERWLLDRAGRERETQMLGLRRQRRQDHQRIVAWNLQPQTRVVLPAAVVVAVETDDVGEEDRVEAARF